MKPLMRHLVNCGLDSLHLTHALLNGDAIFDDVKVSSGAVLDLFKFNGHRTGAR